MREVEGMSSMFVVIIISIAVRQLQIEDSVRNTASVCRCFSFGAHVRRERSGPCIWPRMPSCERGVIGLARSFWPDACCPHTREILIVQDFRVAAALARPF